MDEWVWSNGGMILTGKTEVQILVTQLTKPSLPALQNSQHTICTSLISLHIFLCNTQIIATISKDHLKDTKRCSTPLCSASSSNVHSVLTTVGLCTLHSDTVHYTVILYTTQWHCTLHSDTVHCTVTLYTTQWHCTLHSYTVHYTVTLYTAQWHCTLHSDTVHYTVTLYTAQWHSTLHSDTVHCTVTLYTAQCTVHYTVTLYTAQCTVPSQPSTVRALTAAVCLILWPVKVPPVTNLL